MTLSKTDYILFRDCRKNAWLKVNRPELYYSFTLSDFEKMIIETGNEVEMVARELFPDGVLIEGRDDAAFEKTQVHITNKTPILFQPIFEKDGFVAAIDVLEYHKDTDSYSVYEIKANKKIKKDVHRYDLAFQVNLLKKCNLKIDKAYIILLNPEYIRMGKLNIPSLFKIEDVTEEIENIAEEVTLEMDAALEYVSKKSLPAGYCGCIYRGRSKHCTCFSIINTDLPKYGVHDLTRIGNSKKKLAALVDGNIFNIHHVPTDFELSDAQHNQILAHRLEQPIIDKDSIKSELDALQFPLYFLDYETLSCAVPRHDGYSPYDHIPFQYALYVLKAPHETPELLEFLHIDTEDPGKAFVDSLKSHIGNTGTVIVWHKSFEMSRNNELAKRMPEVQDYIESLNGRVYDLKDIFANQYYVHKDFKGKTSIKKVLPVLVPELTYTDLHIQDGGTASQIWNRMCTEEMDTQEKEHLAQALKSYCGLDAYAMYAIWDKMYKLTTSK